MRLPWRVKNMTCGCWSNFLLADRGSPESCALLLYVLLLLLLLLLLTQPRCEIYELSCWCWDSQPLWAMFTPHMDVCLGGVVRWNKPA